MDEYNPTSTPMETCLKLKRDGEGEVIDSTMFRS